MPKAFHSAMVIRSDSISKLSIGKTFPDFDTLTLALTALRNKLELSFDSDLALAIQADRVATTVEKYAEVFVRERATEIHLHGQPVAFVKRFELNFWEDSRVEPKAMNLQFVLFCPGASIGVQAEVIRELPSTRTLKQTAWESGNL